MPEAWRIEGEYLENCNCEVLCPCLLGPRNAKGGAAARPTEGHCDVPLVFRIARGNHGAVDLSDTAAAWRSEEHTSELQSRLHLVCRLLLEKKKKKHQRTCKSRAT